MATIEVPDEYEDAVIDSLEEVLFEVKVTEDCNYRVVDHDG